MVSYLTGRLRCPRGFSLSQVVTRTNGRYCWMFESSLCGLLQPEDGGDRKWGIRKKPNGDGPEKTDRAKIKPEDCDQSACSVCKESNGVSRHGQHDASDRLRCKVKRHPQAVEAVNWPDNSKIRRANADDLSIAREKSHPKCGKKRDDQSDRCAGTSHRRGAGPRDLVSPVILFGAPVGTHHRDYRGAEAERQRDQDVFEPRAHRVANGDLSAQMSGDSSQEHNREVRDADIDQSRDADFQDFGEQSPLQGHAAKRQSDERAGRTQISEQHEAADAEWQDQAPACTSRAKCRERSPPENQ